MLKQNPLTVKTESCKHIIIDPAIRVRCFNIEDLTDDTLDPLYVPWCHYVF